MATKFKQVYNQMLTDNQKLFDKFGKIHAKYLLDQAKHQEQFNQIGTELMEVVREYENKLCRHSEKGKYAKYSTNLAEKFKQELKKTYSMIDFIGVKTSLDLALDGMKKLI